MLLEIYARNAQRHGSMTTHLPGLKAKHAIITPECRQNRGNDGALVEALKRIRDEYFAIVEARSDQFTCHVVLTVEDAPSDPSGNDSSNASGASSENSSHNSVGK